MKKLIISKTLIFIFVVLFVTGFQKIFGVNNVLIGVTTVVAMLMYLERDLTVSPWKNLLKLLSINVSQGLIAYVSLLNPWIGIPANFIAMFIVGYFFSYNLKKPLYIAFGLQYLFILATPVHPDDLPMRLLALAAGAVIVIAVQLLVNKRKLTKAGNKHVIQICDHLQQKLTLLKDDKHDDELDSLIETEINALRKIIYFRRIEGYYLTHEGRLRLKVSVCLEKLHLILKRSMKADYKDEVLEALKAELDHIKAYLNDDETLPEDSLSLLKKTKTDEDDLYVLEMIKTLKMLHGLLKELHDKETTELDEVEKMVDIPKSYKISYLHFANLSRSSVRFTYAIRLGVVVSLAAFVADYFNIHDGQWIIFTVFSVTQPYAEVATFRFRERIIGTIIGATIFVVLFGIFTDTTTRSFLVLLAGYLNSYAVQYRNVVWTVTIAALGTAALAGDPDILSVTRLFMVIMGISIGIIANKVLLPHTLEYGTKKIMETYKQTSKEMMQEVYNYLKDRNNEHTINNLFAISTLMEERIISNFESLDLKESTEFLSTQRALNHAIYELFLRIQKQRIPEEQAKVVLEEIDEILNIDSHDLDEQVETFIAKLKTKTTKEEFIIIKDILRIFRGFQKQRAY